MKKIVLAALAAILALFASPLSAETERSFHVAGSPDSGHVRGGYTIEWPSGLTAVVNVNGHCVAEEGTDTENCSLGNLSGLGDLYSADVGIGGSWTVNGDYKLRLIADAGYVQIEDKMLDMTAELGGSNLHYGFEFRVEKDRLAVYLRYGDGLDDELAEIVARQVDGFHFGIGYVF